MAQERADFEATQRVMQDPKLPEALEQLGREMIDPVAYLQQRGVQLPDGAEVRIGFVNVAGAAEREETRCWEVCVKIRGVEFCYERCKG